MKKVFNFGKIDYNGSGRKNCPVEVEVNLCERDDDKIVFSASGTIWNPRHTDCYCAGQCLDTIAEYVSDPTFLEILKFWKAYHLNNMRAGTKKQETEIKKWLEQEHYDYDYDLVCEHLASYDLLVDLDEGYRYGSGWIYEPIPENDLNRIKDLLS